MVVGLLGGRADAVDELESRCEPVGLVPRLEGAHDEHPVCEPFVLDLGGTERRHGRCSSRQDRTVWPIGPGLNATSQRKPAGSAKYPV